MWIFPVYPLLIIGPHAGILSLKLDKRHAFDTIIGGFTIQRIGFLIAMMIYASYIYRLITQKLPQESMRPGMFVSVGPSAFTVTGILGMAQNIPRALSKDFMGDSRLVGTILRVVASWMSLWIWGCCNQKARLLSGSLLIYAGWRVGFSLSPSAPTGCACVGTGCYSI